MNYKHICCAVDFSDPSRSALEEAADLARRYASELTLVHAYEVPPAATGDMMLPTPELLAGALKEAEKQLEAWRREAEGLAGRTVKAAVLSGRAADEILRFADEHAADLIVIGTHGRGGVKRLVMGSVAERVVRQATCPVLVIHRPPVKSAA